MEIAKANVAIKATKFEWVVLIGSGKIHKLIQ